MDRVYCWDPVTRDYHDPVLVPAGSVGTVHSVRERGRWAYHVRTDDGLVVGRYDVVELVSMPAPLPADA